MHVDLAVSKRALNFVGAKSAKLAPVGLQLDVEIGRKRRLCCAINTDALDLPVRVRSTTHDLVRENTELDERSREYGPRPRRVPTLQVSPRINSAAEGGHETRRCQ